MLTEVAFVYGEREGEHSDDDNELNPVKRGLEGRKRVMRSARSRMRVDPRNRSSSHITRTVARKSHKSSQ